MLGVVFVFLLQMLAWSAMPVVAMGLDADEGWVVICTSDGYKRIPLTEIGIADTASQQSPDIQAGHCDLCVFVHGLGMAPASVPWVEHVTVVLVLHQRIADNYLPGKLHAPHQPRAPPHKHLNSV